jgi:hypothetical protein
MVNVPIGTVPLDIPVNINNAGSYGIGLRFSGSGQGVNAVFSETAGSSPIRSASCTASDFIEFMVPPLEGDRRYNLRLSGSAARTATLLTLFSLSQGSEDQPYPLRLGDNDGRVGVEWGTLRNTDSYYQLIAGPGRYRFTIGGYPCGTSVAPVAIRGYEWDLDIREPLPVGREGDTPFDTAPAVVEQDNACSHQFELENDTQPNRLYLHLEAIGIRDSSINANRAIHQKYTIRAERL